MALNCGIASVIVVHHHAEHVEDVGALGINEAAGDVVAGAGIVGAITHGERADVDRAETLRIFFEEEFAFIVPEADELLLILFDQGNIERGGHLGETFAHPLITAGAEADGVTPPLVGHFVGSDDFPVAAISPIESEFMANGIVKVIADGNPDETGPGLPEIAGSLLSDVDLGELRRAEVIGVKLDGEFGFGEGFLVETGGAHVAESDGSVALAGQIAGDTLLEGLNPRGRIFVGEGLDQHRRLGELCFFHFEAAEAETSDGLRILTFPDRDVLIAVIGITNERAGSGEFQTFGNAERQIVGGVFTEAARSGIGIPVLTSDGEIIVAAFVGNGFLARVVGGEGEFFAGGERLGENDGEVRVIVFVFLNEGEGLAIGL